MDYILPRFSTGHQSTLGAIFAKDGGLEFKCFTLEDQYQEVKVEKETRIPAGRYEIKLRKEGEMHSRYSSKFPWHRGMLWLQDVPEFEWVYIHILNHDDQTEGCIGVGDSSTSNTEGRRGSIGHSTDAYRRLYSEMVAHLVSGERVFINIKDYC